MTRRRVLSVALLFAAGAVGGFVLVHRAPPALWQQPDVDALLDAPIADARLGPTTYVKAADYLRSLAPHANIAFNWASLAEFDIHPDTPLLLDLRLHNVQLKDVLNVVLSSGGNPGARLHYSNSGNVIMVAALKFSGHDLDPSYDVETRSYDVRDLVTKDGDWEFLTTDLSGKPPHPQPLTIEERGDLITTTIEHIVDHDSWRDYGGNMGAIRMLRGFLIVTQSQPNLDAVADVLEMLRHAGRHDSPKAPAS